MTRSFVAAALIALLLGLACAVVVVHYSLGAQSAPAPTRPADQEMPSGGSVGPSSPN